MASISSEPSDQSSDDFSPNTPDESLYNSSAQVSDEALNRADQDIVAVIGCQDIKFPLDASITHAVFSGKETLVPRLLPISASSEKSLQTRMEDLRRYVETRPELLDDLAYTLAHRRVHLSHRTFCIAKEGTDTIIHSQSLQKGLSNPKKDGSIAFVFTGQGTQWFGMAGSIARNSSTFLQDIREMDHALQQLIEPPCWTLEGMAAGYIPNHHY